MRLLEPDNFTRIEIEVYVNNDRAPGLARKIEKEIAEKHDLLIGSNLKGAEFVEVRSVSVRFPEEVI